MTVKIPFTSKWGKKTYLTCKSKNDYSFDTSTKHKLADRVAKEWGNINESETIFNINGNLLKNYDCSGHGGYILVTDKPLVDIKPDLSQNSYHPINLFKKIEFYVYSFEEDCEWAKLFLILSSSLFEIVEQKWKEKLIAPPKQSLKEYAKQSLQRWNSDFVYKGKRLN